MITCASPSVDDSATQPRLRDYGAEAVTGRGIFLVDQISERWGVEPEVNGQDGKRVWFEIAATNATSPTNEVRSMNDSATYPVVLPGFPIALFLEARQHNEALVREFTFIVEAESDPTDIPVRLLTLARQLRDRFYGLNATLEVQVEAAVAPWRRHDRPGGAPGALRPGGSPCAERALRRSRRVLPARRPAHARRVERSARVPDLVHRGGRASARRWPADLVDGVASAAGYDSIVNMSATPAISSTRVTRGGG